MVLDAFLLKMFAKQIAEGWPLEVAMKLSRVATPLDWENAFGSSEGWTKWGGGRKGGSRGAGHKGKNTSSKSNSQASKANSMGSMNWCDIRVKTDIAPLERTEVNNDLAELAFFVKELRVK